MVRGFFLYLSLASIGIFVMGNGTLTFAKGPQPTANISADRTIIQAGEAVILTWSTQKADSAEIDNGLGTVALNGTMKIFPSVTTTYTITAFTSGGNTVADSVTITISTGPPPPTLVFAADPDTISPGGASTLSWTSTNTDTVSIDNGIGVVQINGEITVSPLETSNYTISATGPGGTVSETVQVTVEAQKGPSVTVTLDASPISIQTGSSTTLSWESTKAIRANIDNNIGEVPVDGTLNVSPAETTTYTITAFDRKGNTATTTVLVKVSPIEVSITNPLGGEIVLRPDVLVRGTWDNLTHIETGISVNGVRALVEGNVFAANHVRVSEGDNIITARAVDIDQNIAEQGISVTANAANSYLRLNSNFETGLSPLDVELRVEENFTFAGVPTISHEGPGQIEYLETPDPNIVHIRITTPGIYFITAEAQDDQSNIYIDTLAVQVFDQLALDALLKAKWEGMKSALMNQDVEGGLSHFLDSSKNNYRDALNTIGADLSQIVGDFGGIELIYSKNNRVKYRMNRVHDIDGQLVTITYYVYFVKDEKGLWKIEQF